MTAASAMPGRSLPVATADESRVLVLPPTSADGRAIAKLFSGHQIPFMICTDSRQLCQALREGAAVVTLSEEALLSDSAELLRSITEQPVWADLPIIVLSKSVRESPTLTQMLPQLGNVSLVERPVRTSTLISLVRSCLRARERQYMVREYLARQEEAQRTIREGERRYRSLIENVRDYAIFMTDRDGRINSWNDGAAAIFGYSADEVLGKPAGIFSTDADLKAGIPAREMGEAARQSGAPSRRLKVCKDGRQLLMEGVLVPVRDETERIVGFAHFMRDVTEKHRTEIEREQLLDSERAARGEAERASRTKDEFLATLSHELRTPLNAVLGWVQLLRRSPNLSSDVADGLIVIERNSRSQAQIIEDLLDMSSIISGKVRLKVQPLDLAPIVEATLETIRPAAQTKGIVLQLVMDPGAGPVRGDPNRLQQVLWNLLTNAVKFTPKGGRISIAVACIDSHLDIEVSDTGEGIDPTFLPYIFDRFRQADASTSRRHGGLGLGLSIVKQLVELHGGAITASSAGPGSGSTFRITLPLMVTVEDPLESDRPAVHPSRSVGALNQEIGGVDLTGVRILVVDDEADARHLLQRLLQDCGATVYAAGSAAQAIQLLSERSPAVLVSDIGMPGEDGYALIRRIRSLQDGNARIPAVALTAYARVEDRVRAIQAGYQMHLSKPVEPVELIAMVGSLATGADERAGAPANK